MRPDIGPGGVFPDYELPDHTGKPCKLSELQGDDPLILTLARGHYCPKEHQQHLELAAFYPKLRCRTLRSLRSPPTITILCRNSVRPSEPSGHSFWTPREQSEGSRHPGVHRPGAQPDDPAYARAQAGPRDLQHYNGYWYWGRPSVIDLWHDCAWTSQIRPDWDLSRRGLREAWNAGDSAFPRVEQKRPVWKMPRLHERNSGSGR